MEIRDATVDDVAAVRALISSLVVCRNDMVTTGFVELPVPSVEQLTTWATDNPFFLVACDTGRIIGFYLGFHVTSATPSEDDEILAQLQDHFDDFVYLDLLGVSPAYQHQGIGEELKEAMCERVDEEGQTEMYAAVAAAPLANLASARLNKKMGFTVVCQIAISDGLLFDIYHKKLTPHLFC